MNEGWASHWHHRLMTALDLPQDIHLEFLVRHNQVICPNPGGLNPYHVGFMVWRDIEKRFGGASIPRRAAPSCSRSARASVTSRSCAAF